MGVSMAGGGRAAPKCLEWNWCGAVARARAAAAQCCRGGARARGTVDMVTAAIAAARQLLGQFRAVKGHVGAGLALGA